MLLSDVENLALELVQHDAATLTGIGINVSTAVNLALVRLNKDVPAELVEDQTIADSRYAALPANWVYDKSEVVNVEHPIDASPREYLDDVVPYRSPTETALDLLCVVTGEVRIRYTVPHVLDVADASLTTVPDAHLEAVASYVGGLIASQLATHYSKNVSSGFNADRVNQDDKPRNFTALSKRLLARYDELVAEQEDEDEAAGSVVEVELPARLFRRY